ncbi:type II secretion system secretin GspD [Maridesulfovibrio salexigens]|uniref:General secretion pathway protein D n=1 Tax=Maridesulfovibrio salexigens (strain ATCC 14822 / DSM 2638 / NCIMB 8403 / VKM B-1763) TaxID=526222 RepID=C6BTY5_MARSD|nr:type II secretion system secretin GspD [Maridesulfovibrio salexigens]ACS81694.1 general secretion pathway protein D [Maridesulfovibrio salexigens DSM 2638]
MALNMLNKFCKFFVVLFLSMFLMVSAAAAQPEGGDGVHANLESIALDEFVKFVGRYTGRNIVFNKESLPRTFVSIYAGQSLTEPELMAVFQQVLSGSGFHAVTRDNVTYVLPIRDAKTISPEIKAAPSKGNGEEIITSVFQLAGKMDPAKVQAVLTQVKSRIGTVTSVPMADAVMVMDLQDNVNKMKKLLGILKRAGAQQEHTLIELEKSNSKTVATKLTSFYKKLFTSGKTGAPPVIESLDWANSLLVSGSSDQIDTIKSLIGKLDRTSESYSKMKIYRLHNIEAVVAGEVLKSLISGGGIPSEGNSKNSVAGDSAAKSSSSRDTSSASSNDSGGVQVSADEATNTLIVMAPTDQLSQIDNFVEQLDQAQDQVYIEALVLETTLDHAKEFGVEWQGGIDLGGSVATLGYTKAKDSNLSAYASNPSNVPGGYSMGVLGDTISYAGRSFPTIGALVNFTKSATDFNLISAPQIMTLDNAEAEIFVGQNRPYKTGQSSTSGDAVVSTYEYKDVGIKLKITPRINREDGLVKLKVYQTYNTVSEASTTELPITNDRKTDTTVLLADGSTMVIGGLIRADHTRTEAGVPYLSDLPLLGWLFKTTSNSGNKNTLMVFLSARIIQTTEGLEALSKAKMDKYRNQRNRISNFIDEEFSTLGSDSKKSDDKTPSISDGL